VLGFNGGPFPTWQVVMSDERDNPPDPLSGPSSGRTARGKFLLAIMMRILTGMMTFVFASSAGKSGAAVRAVLDAHTSLVGGAYLSTHLRP
jgi:hypothetical protein